MMSSFKVILNADNNTQFNYIQELLDFDQSSPFVFMEFIKQNCKKFGKNLQGCKLLLFTL